MEHGIIKYIDFDLDFRIPNAKGDIINEVDLDEYSENKVKYQYPQKLIEKIKIVEADIVKSFKNREFDQYIDRELIDYYNRHMKTKRNNDE
jgi:protein associated with RNAse G/E